MKRGHRWAGWCLILFSVCVLQSSLFFLNPPSSNSQEFLHIRPGGRMEELPPPFPEEPQLPPPQIVEPKPPFAAPEKGKVGPTAHMFVREIKVSGSTIFSAEELGRVTGPYVNRELTSEDLEAVRRALTILYINKGYINSGAVIPDQTVVSGVINIQIIEGKLTDIEVNGNRWLRTSYYLSRIALDSVPPVNVYALQQRLQYLQQDDRVQQIHAELKPGLEPGESELMVRVDEKLPFSAVVGFNNYQSPTVGGARGFTTLVDKSLTGYGDILSFTYFGSEGVNPGVDTWYSFPITSRDTTLVLRYQLNDFSVIEQPFGPLNITSKSDMYGIGLRQPLYRSLNQEFALALGCERSHDEQFLLGEPFQFSLGAVDGKSTVTALRFSQEWLYRTQNQVIGARSRFSFGLDALGATINEGPGPVPDGRSFSWLGQFQWARILGSYGIQAIFRTDIQLSNDPLLPLEQIPIGGRYSVRGYIENQFVRDNGLISSLETRIPILQNIPWADYLQLAPFIDFGKGWNTQLPTPAEDILLSTGIGLRWGLTCKKDPFPIKTDFEIYWGYPLMHVQTTGDDLQNKGIHMQLTISAF